jgi:hypothetical protein
MKRTLVLGLLGTLGLLIAAERSQAAHPVCGTWHMNQPGIGESDLKITERPDGSLHVQEMGLGNVKGTGTFAEGVLTLRFGDTNFGGYWEFRIDREHENGKGKTVFTHGQPPTDMARQVRRDGKTVFELDGVTIRRTGR